MAFVDLNKLIKKKKKGLTVISELLRNVMSLWKNILVELASL